MGKENKYRKAKASDFYDYFEGKMSVEERNAFERQMQKELFNEEAAEGFAMISREEAEADLALLSGKIQRRIKRKRRIAWYSAAAAIAAIAIVGSIFFNVDNTRDEFETMPQFKEAAKEKGSPLKSEIAELESDPTTLNTSADKNEESIEGAEPDSDMSALEFNSGAGLAEPTVQEEDIDQTSAEELNKLALDTQTDEMEGFDMQDDAIANESLESEGVGDISDSEGAMPVGEATGTKDFEGDYKETQELPQAQYSASAKSTKKKESEVMGRLVSENAEEESAAGSEDLEVSNIPAPSSANRRAVSMVNTSNISTNLQIALPLSGMASYKSYIDSVLVFPKENYELERANVVLSFSVTPEGRPSTIRVIQSPASSFSNEAIRVVQEGPDWSPAEREGEYVDDALIFTVEFGQQHKR